MHTWWLQLTFLVGCSEVGRFGPAQISLLSPASLTIRIKMAQKILLHKTNAFSPLHFLQNHQDWSGSQKPRQLPPSLELEVESH